MHYFIAVRHNIENLVDSSLDLKKKLNFCSGIQCNYQLPYPWFMHSDITSTISLLIKNTNKLKKTLFYLLRVIKKFYKKTYKKEVEVYDFVKVFRQELKKFLV